MIDALPVWWLEYLSLVSKVLAELETHLGVADRVLAEFVTELGRRSAPTADFEAKLRENGGDLPDYLVRYLHTVITAILRCPAQNPTPVAGREYQAKWPRREDGGGG
ncbi:hypothetical protein BAE44_0002382 [Dichanthelium oligosanthes]|uniref:Uncharacterized protein n=1 Tax=Dichanthelium oligosanthes TaxID=888268 RepID=A0A1E5WGS3_9POAL|nr:hypothetical protein BAE44_0002382 [Dichanthelium oligosanthes]